MCQLLACHDAHSYTRIRQTYLRTGREHAALIDWQLLPGKMWQEDWVFPVNKNIWTSSYVLYTSGLLVSGLEPKVASLIYAPYLFIVYIPVYILYRKKIFIKL